MRDDITYDKIIKTLFSEDIEEYVPDGTSISHPIFGIYNNRIVDCFLLYAISRDRSMYSIPTARIIIDSEIGKLVLYKTIKEMPFAVFDGTEYFENDKNSISTNNLETEYHSLYEKVRIIAFKEKITNEEKKLLYSFLSTLKNVELKYLQPYLFELGQPFFEWVKSVMG